MTSENGKPKDKRSVIASKIKSALKLFHIQCYWPCCDGFDFLGIRWHNMSEKRNFPSKEVTLSRHQSKTISPYTIKHLPLVADVIFKGKGADDER